MKNKSSILLSAILAVGFIAIVSNATSQQDEAGSNVCSADPLYFIFDKYIPVYPHEYWDVLLNKPPEYWDWQLHKVEVGNHKSYEPLEPIGKGNFSKVIAASHTVTGEIFAIKVMSHNKTWKILNEIHIMDILKDAPNFLPVLEVLRDQTTKSVALVFDLFPKEEYKPMFYALEEPDIKLFMYETLRTLEYAHSKGIMHRDIKPLNVLMNRELQMVKVIDWGHADFYFPGKLYSPRVASMYYKSPELLLNYSYYDYSHDIWSAGCMFGSMIFKKIPMFKAQNWTAMLEEIAKHFGTDKLNAYIDVFGEDMTPQAMEGVNYYPPRSFHEYVNSTNKYTATPQAIDLLDKMLKIDHRRRISAREALAHPYFDDVRNREPSPEPQRQVYQEPGQQEQDVLNIDDYFEEL